MGQTFLALAVAWAFAPVSATPAPPREDAALPTVGGQQGGSQTLWERDSLTGDWDGLRPWLVDEGITLGLAETSEVLGNVSGGRRQGFNYMGRTELAVDLDLYKIVGWQGAFIHANGYQLHGRGLGGNNLGGNILVPSTIEATRTTRLFDAYIQQSLFDDKLSVRAGQIAADDEFMISQYGATTFVNSTFGWAGIMGANLPSGGPASPLATPGVRARYAPTAAFSWQTAVFNGDPAGSPQGNENPQIRNRAGTTFSTNRDLFVISEVAFVSAADQASGDLPATVKFGGWYHSGNFADRRYDSQGGLLGVTGGTPRQDRNNGGLYGVVDQMLLAKPGTADQGLAGFAQVAGAPDDRNLVSFYATAGVRYKGPLERRDKDVVGIAVSYAKVGQATVDADKDYNRANPTAIRPVHDYEAAVELTYQYVATPWWTIQPDFQYIVHPAGFAGSPTADPAETVPAMGNAFILGARTTVRF